MKTRQNTKLIFDAASERYRDENGFLHVRTSNVSKEQVAPYYGREIPDSEELGLDPEHIYYGYRSAKELALAAETTNGLPILLRHHNESAENPQRDFRVGSMGSSGRFEAPYLKNALAFTDSRGIEEIESGKATELSLSYFFDPVMTRGVWNGEPYDFIMTNIRANHLALVPEGRAGSDVAVADAQIVPNPLTPRNTFMTKAQGKLRQLLRKLVGDEDIDAEKTENELINALAEVNSLEAEQNGKADDAPAVDKNGLMQAILELCGPGLDEAKMTLLKDRLSELAYAPAEGKTADSDLAADKPCGDAEGAKEVPAKDAYMTPEQKKAFEEGVKYAENLLKKPGEAQKLDGEHESQGAKAAMDAALQKKGYLRAADLQAVFDAQREVRPIVGELAVNLARDSADDVYGTALDCLGINKKAHPRAAWRSVFQTYRQTKGNGGYALAHDAALGSGTGLDGDFANLKTMKIKD